MPVNSVRRNGSYAPLSAHYYKDDAIDEAGLESELLYVRGLAFCADVLSDGFISDRQLIRFVGVGMDDAAERAKRLVAVDLWERVDNGYQIRSWLTWNRSREEITDRQTKDAQRKAKGRPSESDVPPPEPPDEPPDPSERTPIGVRSESDDPSDTVRSESAPRARTPRHSTPRHETTTSSDADASDTAGFEAKQPKTRRATSTEPEGFAEWYAVFPRHEARAKAAPAYRTALRKPGVTGASLLAGARRYAALVEAEGREKTKILLPPSWLNGERWNDEIPASTGAQVRHLAVAADPSANPDEAFADLRRRAAAPEAARFLGITCLIEPQPPSDHRHPRQWEREQHIQWLDAHERQLRAAFTERKTG